MCFLSLTEHKRALSFHDGNAAVRSGDAVSLLSHNTHFFHLAFKKSHLRCVAVSVYPPDTAGCPAC